jgi:hypothetical protein
MSELLSSRWPFVTTCEPSVTAAGYEPVTASAEEGGDRVLQVVAAGERRGLRRNMRCVNIRAG